MSSIYPVSLERHTRLRWRRFTDYAFTRNIACIPLAAAEVSKAAAALPLAFLKRDGDLTLAAVLGLTPGQNLFVSPQGNWIAGYTPAAFRAYPFRTVKNDAGQSVLCVDEASGLVGEGTEGETFFGDSGEPSEAVMRVWGFLQETAKSEEALYQACRALSSTGVIEPWPITFQGENGPEHIAGLHRVNEVVLSGLDDTAFGVLRRAGIVGLAYAQLFSMTHLAKLGELAQARAQAEAAERARAEVKPMIALPDDSTIDWDWSKVGKT